MPTLEDVARRAGVSTATVSKVLSNTPYFSERTRAKVLQAVKEIGYVPNLAARALSSGKTQIIAFVFPYVYDALFADPFVLLILEGIESECHQRGYNLLLSTPRIVSGQPDEHYLQLVQSGYIDGFIALDSVPSASVVEPVFAHGIPSVTIGYHPNTFFVRADDCAGGFQAMDHVLKLGHRRIGVISVNESLHFSISQRLAGLRAAAEAYGLDFDTLPMAEGDFSTASGAACAAELLSRHPDLTALVCLNDRMAIGALQQLHVRAIRVPDQMTVIGYDDIPTAAIIVPPLTTVNQQAFRQGQEAARMLLDILNGRSPQPITLPVELVVRGSSAPVPAPGLTRKGG